MPHPERQLVPEPGPHERDPVDEAAVKADDPGDAARKGYVADPAPAPGDPPIPFADDAKPQPRR